MRFTQVDNLWIPEGTRLSDHPPKARNLHLMHDVSVPGVSPLEGTVSLPYMDSAGAARKAIIAATLDKQIGIKRADHLLRSQWNFEDTLEHRAAGIGLSVPVRRGVDINEGLRRVLEKNRHLEAFVENFGIRNPQVGLQISPMVHPKQTDLPFYSGSLRLLAPDLMYISAREGYGFNGPSDWWGYFMKSSNTWSVHRENRDSNRNNYADWNDFLPLFQFMDALIKKKHFKGHGIEIEFAGCLGDYTVVQYTPVHFQSEPNLGVQQLDHQSFGGGLIIGHGQTYFPPENIFISGWRKKDDEVSYDYREEVSALREMNTKGRPFLIIDTWRFMAQTKAGYADVSNAKALINVGYHMEDLSHHFPELGRETGMLIAIPKSWTHHFTNGFVDASARERGITIRVNERNQIAEYTYGEVKK